MNIIGIDFSILYPGICISTDFNSFKWIGFTNTKITKKESRFIEDVNSLYSNLKVIELGERPAKNEQYHINEGWRFQARGLDGSDEVGVEHNPWCEARNASENKG